MNAEQPHRKWKLTALKIVVGSMAALVSVFSGEQACGGWGLFSMFDSCFFDLGYFLRFGLFEISVTLLAFSLLLSAFVDVFSNLKRITLLGRGIESVADMPVDD